MISTIAIGGLAKRLVEDPPTYKLPDFAPVVFLADFILFLPVLIIIGYTLGHVYPTLAAVEDPLPAYEAVSMNDDNLPKDDNDPIRATAQPGKPVTGSIRAINRLLRSYGGWRVSFRGFGYAIVIGILTVSTTGFLALAPFIPARIAHLLALVAIAPLSTTWTHFIITPPPAPDAPRRSFFRRIPRAGKVYAATWFPTFLLWAAAHAAVFLPAILGRVIGLPMPDPNQPMPQPGQPGAGYSGSDIGKLLCVAGVSVALQALLVIPAHAALTRVQASLLPADEDPVVPFDRSFGGRVEPEVVTGKGFATFGAALKTIPLASWGRIYLLRVKIFAVGMAAYTVMAVVVALELVLLSKKAERRP